MHWTAKGYHHVSWIIIEAFQFYNGLHHIIITTSQITGNLAVVPYLTTKNVSKLCIDGTLLVKYTADQ